MPFSKNKSQSEKIAMISLGFFIVLIVVLTSISLVENGLKSQKPVLVKKTEKIQTKKIEKKIEQPKKTNPEIKLSYEKNIKQILETLDQKIQKAGSLEDIDQNTIQELKDMLIKLMVPKEYQNLHLDFVLMLDMISSNQITKAQDNLNKIKNTI